MGWAYDKFGRHEKCIVFWLTDLRERDYFEEHGLDRRILLKLILKKWDGDAWTGLSWLRTDKCWAHVNIVNLRIPQNAGNFLTS